LPSAQPFAWRILSPRHCRLLLKHLEKSQEHWLTLQEPLLPGLVKATNNATSQVRQVETNEAGSYTIPFLAPGHYQVRAEKAGFKTATRADVLLQVADSVRVNFTIEVGNVSESVEVREEAALLTSETERLGPSSITNGLSIYH